MKKQAERNRITKEKGCPIYKIPPATAGPRSLQDLQTRINAGVGGFGLILCYLWCACRRGLARVYLEVRSKSLRSGEGTVLRSEIENLSLDETGQSCLRYL